MKFPPIKSVLALAASTTVLAVAQPALALDHHGEKPADMAKENPLLKTWTGPFEGVPPWDKVKVSDIGPAFEGAMAQTKAEFDAIRDNPAKPTFKNTNEAIEQAGEVMNIIFPIWGVQRSNVATDDVRKLQAKLGPKISKFFNELSLDPKMFQRYKSVYDNRKKMNLNAEQMRLVERDYERLVRNGALLEGAEKEALIAVNQKLSTLFNEFSNAVLADEEISLILNDPKDLAGLPDSFVASLKSAADKLKVRGYALANTRSVMQPFLQNSTRRDLREIVYKAYVNRGDNKDKNDTNAVIAKILKHRADRAKILGFKTHAHFRMADTMAKDPERAMDLMMKVWPAAVARVKEEVADMQAVANKENAGITIEPWDYRFYAEKVRKDKYDLDAASIKPYFELDNMIKAVFYSAGRLYDMEFKENTGDVPVFHPDVRTFVVTDKRDGSNIGLFYMDNFARAGKRSGAWMTTYRSQQTLGGERNVLASNNNNFVKGGAGEPTLISLDDASTLFHEFGHAIHYFMQDVYYPGLAGTPRDFVEYPSQVNENWLLTRDVLDNFAKHYKTGEAMPQALVDKIEKSSTFNQGFSTVEYLSSAIIDMKLHNRTTPVTDVDKFERETLAEMGMPKEIVMRHRLPQFNHLFSSDAYSAGYYSYLWSETMDADTWAAFMEKGDAWHKPTADKFRKFLLATGNETERAAAYRAFRGRDPDVNALLRKRGFPVPKGK